MRALSELVGLASALTPDQLMKPTRLTYSPELRYAGVATPDIKVLFNVYLVLGIEHNRMHQESGVPFAQDNKNLPYNHQKLHRLIAITDTLVLDEIQITFPRAGDFTRFEIIDGWKVYVGDKGAAD